MARAASVPGRRMAGCPSNGMEMVKDFMIPSLDFEAFLKGRYPTKQSTRKTKRIKLFDEPFIGMWRGREDIKDGAAWVRSLRKQEWKRSA